MGSSSHDDGLACTVVSPAPQNMFYYSWKQFAATAAYDLAVFICFESPGFSLESRLLTWANQLYMHSHGASVKATLSWLKKKKMFVMF